MKILDAPTCALIAGIYNDQEFVTSGAVTGDQRKIYYRLVAAPQHPGEAPQVFDRVVPSHARVWPDGVPGLITSAAVGHTAFIAWYGDESRQEARFFIAESLPTPDLCEGEA